MKPIKPDELGEATVKLFPPEVFEAVNECIVSKWNGSHANFTQQMVIDKILEKLPNLEKADVYSRGYLNFEEAYRVEGWHVEYDKPGYNENYSANFTFQRTK